MAPLAAFSPICEAGYVYGINEVGRIRQVAPNGSVTNFGSSAPGVSSFNGLGIGSNGDRVFGYERSSAFGETSVSRATIYSFNTTTGTWSSTGQTVNSNNSSRTVQFVAGGVNLQNGRYYLGGFSSTGAAFRIWEYNPGTNGVVYKGNINTSSGSGGLNNNGDLAFDAAGNLFVVRGSGTTTTVFSVTAANLAAANGGVIPSSGSNSVTTMDNVNGVAFDSSGRAFLGSIAALRSYSMPSWTGSTNVVTNGLDSTDLATCSSPPTITIEKFVQGARVATTDQFTLRLNQGSQVIGTATTTGNASGLQAERVGPLPTVRGVALEFSETAAGTTNLADYAGSAEGLVESKTASIC